MPVARTAHVELCGRLIEQHHSRPEPHSAQGAGESDALPLPAGEVGAASYPRPRTVSRLARFAAPADSSAARTTSCGAPAGAALDKAVDDPAGEAEQAEFLGGRRIDREPEGVVGVTLRAAHLVGVAVTPDGALTQQPVSGEPCAAEQEGRPPRVTAATACVLEQIREG